VLGGESFVTLAEGL
jgi:hypothetical protein